MADSTMTLEYHDLPVSPPASPGDDANLGQKKRPIARTQTVTAGANALTILELNASLDEARTAEAPVGILLQLAKNLSSARQRAKVGQTAASEMRPMDLKLEAVADAAADGPTIVRLASWERTLNREGRLCDEALAEARWVREFGDSVISESERLDLARRAAYARESAALSIQDAYRNFKQPLVDSYHELDYTPAEVSCPHPILTQSSPSPQPILT